MTMRRFGIILFFISLQCLLWAQDNLSAGKHLKLAEQFAKQNQYEKAALHYEAAWSKKPKKLEWLNQAGLFYLKIREYNKAAEAFATLKGNKLFPESRLNYAIALQQSGQYDEAIPEFLLYLNSYEGKDRDQMSERIEEYINGCSLAIRQNAAPKTDSITIEHLSEGVNTPENEVAPLPFNDDILYFTGIKDNKALILRSQQLSNDWSLAQVANLPVKQDVSFGNGTFSADGTRFYYTQCQTVKTKKEEHLSCELYVLKRAAGGWSEPIRLPNDINTEGGMTTQPTVFEKDGKEYLFFVSDRKGGRGGMDIWQASRFLKNENFSPAQNLGMPVNTDKDEVTPFYDLTEGVLYFSSNGRATLGGLDIFKSKGFNRQWFVPENLGMPFNSGADDWYFIKKQSRTGGFFVSNRSVGMEKISSRDDDIFSFYLKEKNIELVAQGKVYEKDGQNLIENARISLFEQRERNEPRLLSSVMSPDGNFNFVLLPQKKYAIEVEKDGFRIASMNIMTVDTMKVVNRDFYLEKYAVLASNKIEKHIERVNEKPPIVVATKKTEPNSPKAEKNTPPTEGPKKTEPKKESSVTYKIQLMAYEEMTSIQSRRLSRVEDMGDIETETAVVGGKNYTRVMLAKFETYTEAEKALRTVKNRSLNDAFIIRYENGKRTNKSR